MIRWLAIAGVVASCQLPVTKLEAGEQTRAGSSVSVNGQPETGNTVTTGNRLHDSSSRYLRQHARNPVDWYPWGDEAFAKAKRENKPIFLSIGYSTCHWCHVMDQQSFSDR